MEQILIDEIKELKATVSRLAAKTTANSARYFYNLRQNSAKKRGLKKIAALEAQIAADRLSLEAFDESTLHLYATSPHDIIKAHAADIDIPDQDALYTPDEDFLDLPGYEDFSFCTAPVVSPSCTEIPLLNKTLEGATAVVAVNTSDDRVDETVVSKRKALRKQAAINLAVMWHFEPRATSPVQIIGFMALQDTFRPHDETPLTAILRGKNRRPPPTPRFRRPPLKQFVPRLCFSPEPTEDDLLEEQAAIREMEALHAFETNIPIAGLFNATSDNYCGYGSLKAYQSHLYHDRPPSNAIVDPYSAGFCYLNCLDESEHADFLRPRSNKHGSMAFVNMKVLQLINMTSTRFTEHPVYLHQYSNYMHISRRPFLPEAIPLPIRPRAFFQELSKHLRQGVYPSREDQHKLFAICFQHLIGDCQLQMQYAASMQPNRLIAGEMGP